LNGSFAYYIALVHIRAQASLKTLRRHFDLESVF